MKVGEVRVAEDTDFDLLKIYLSRNDGWKLEYEKGATAVWTRDPPEHENNAFKMIRVKTRFNDVAASVVFDVLHDPEYRKTWDKFMVETTEIGHLNPNNNISYYSLSCPSPMKNRDLVIQTSWLQTQKESFLINHSVFHKAYPPKRGYVRAISYLTGFLVTQVPGGCCEVGYISHTNPRGHLPAWVSNRVSTTFAPKLVKRLHKACLGYPSWKERHHRLRKPWIFAEQISSPRIQLTDCQATHEETANNSSPDDSIEDEDEELVKAACDTIEHDLEDQLSDTE